MSLMHEDLNTGCRVNSTKGQSTQTRCSSGQNDADWKNPQNIGKEQKTQTTNSTLTRLEDIMMASRVSAEDVLRQAKQTEYISDRVSRSYDTSWALQTRDQGLN